MISARSPADCFEVAIEACRIAVQYMTPVILLTDGYIANAAEPWKVPDPASYAPFPVTFLQEKNAGEQPAAVQARRQGRAPVDQARHAGPDASHRRDREARRDRQHRLFARQPPGDDRRAQGQDRRHRGARSGRDARRRHRHAGGGRLGQHVRPDPPGGAPRAQAGPRRQPHPCAPRLAAAQEPRRAAARASTRCWCRR